MPEEPIPGRLGTEARRVKFPDGSHGVILVRAGLPQDEADLIAAQVWAEIQEDRPPAGTPSSPMGA
ncbi:hypothetical protein GCM10011579_080660 [Streptomyces albiflavescens]|uniref:Uncharacterized protein n=1 Tax=Streptomyces albiflavescens TaxID=1623582 RepID=A0A918D919_9ACTN|nr:hypothetical protein GCM10011579_080660 [Streptomyces albiflavescens]